VEFDHSVNSAVKKLRQALGDDSDNPRFIETLPRRGYRFLVPVAGREPSSGQIAETPPPAAPKTTNLLFDYRILIFRGCGHHRRRASPVEDGSPLSERAKSPALHSAHQRRPGKIGIHGH
jgi:hypothetical protein